MSVNLKVYAGNHNRFSCPVSAKLERRLPFERGALVTAAGKRAQAQISAEGGGAKVTWILDYLLKGEAMEYGLAEDDAAPLCKSEDRGDKVDVYLPDGYYTTYYYGDKTVKPYLGPFKGANGEQITRLNPDEREHVHHRSVWISHGSVNGVDTWNEPAGVHGRILNKGIGAIENGPALTCFTAANTWTDFDRKPLLDDKTKIIFYAGPPTARIVDFEIALFANYGDVILGGTKEAGPIAVRMNYNLAVDETGTMINGYGGINEGEVWMKRAPWCDYYGLESGRTCGAAILDNPENVGYPSYWHSRNYGLMAPNNFHIPGDTIIAAGGCVTYKYRMIFHAGDAATADIAGKFHDYASPPAVTAEYI